MNEADDRMARLPELLSSIRTGIHKQGFVTGTIEGDVLYTIGLTEIRHPELVIIGPRPAVTFLEEWAPQVLARQRIIAPPSMFWTDPCAGGQHLLSVTPYTAGLGLVAAVYGAYTAVRIDLTSCPCAACADTVVVDSDGNYVRDSP